MISSVETAGVEGEPAAGSAEQQGGVHRRYLAALAVAAGCLLCMVIAINWIVDPLALGGLLEDSAFPSDYRYEREVRYNTLLARRPDVVILGTSQTGHGIDPANPLLGGRNAYNAALSGGTIDELGFLMRHVAKLGSVRRVVFGIDYLMEKQGGGQGFNDAFLGSSGRGGWLKAMEARLSTTMLLSSFKEILEKRSHSADYADYNGHLLPARFEAQLRGKGGPYRAMSGSIETTAKKLLGAPAGFDRDLHEIIELACRNHIDLTFFAPPAHVYSLETVRDLNLLGELEAWERFVVDSVQAAPCPVTFWDFTRVNAVTTEAVPPPGIMAPMAHYWDMQHYKSAVGDAVLAEMSGAGEASPPGLGERLTPDNLDAYQSQRRAALATYEAGHPQDVARIKAEVAGSQGEGQTERNGPIQQDGP